MSASKQKIIVIVLLMSCLQGVTSWASWRVLPAPIEPPLPRFAVLSAPEAKPEPPKKENEETPLETILRKWAEADAKNQEMHVRFINTKTNPVYDETTITKGRASIKQPDLWRIDRLDKRGQTLDILLLVDKRLHLFDAERQTERILIVLDDPKADRKNGIRRDPLWFVWNWDEQGRWLSFGPQARDMDSRYKLDLSKQDQWYIYLEILPLSKRSSWFDWLSERWFERGRIVLDSKTYEVRQVWLEYPNRETVKVDFLERQTNPTEAITRESLLKGLPQGWRREELTEPDKEKK